MREAEKRVRMIQCQEDSTMVALKMEEDGKGKKTDYSLDSSLILSQLDCFRLLIYITVR